jgi:hypothetical protein
MDSNWLKAQYMANSTHFFGLWGFIEAFGDIRTTDPEIIRLLIEEVEREGIFRFRFQAMIALGKIGPPAGLSAVKALRAHIYDSSESVRDLRERVIQRITTPANLFVKCTNCHRGRILDIRQSFLPIRCPLCLELGFVPAQLHA